MTIVDQGTIILFIPKDDEELKWLQDNVEAESWQWLGRGSSLCREPDRRRKGSWVCSVMKFRVVDTFTNQGIESHGEARYAFRACVILNAHELHNGRVWRYSVQPAVDPIPLEELNLPDWAMTALNKVIEGR